MMKSSPESGHLGAPKKVAIVFLGDHRKEAIKTNNIQKLGFHKFACAHLLVQMNSIQDLFVFQVLFGEEDGFKLPRENENEKESLGSSFCKEITEFIKGNQEKGWNETDYWIGITSKEPKEITGETTTTTQYIYKVECPKTKIEEEPNRNIHIITSKDWEKKYCL